MIAGGDAARPVGGAGRTFTMRRLSPAMPEFTTVSPGDHIKLMLDAPVVVVVVAVASRDEMTVRILEPWELAAAGAAS